MTLTPQLKKALNKRIRYGKTALRIKLAPLLLEVIFED